MLDFYFVIHYVLYRYYMKKDFGRFLSMTTACMFLASIFEILLMCVVGLLLKLTNTPIDIGKFFIIIYILMFVGIEYIIFYRNGKYLDVFLDYDRRSNTPTMMQKCRYAKLFNLCVLVMDFGCLCLVDYINHH